MAIKARYFRLSFITAFALITTFNVVIIHLFLLVSNVFSTFAIPVFRLGYHDVTRDAPLLVFPRMNLSGHFANREFDPARLMQPAGKLIFVLLVIVAYFWGNLVGGLVVPHALGENMK